MANLAEDSRAAEKCFIGTGETGKNVEIPLRRECCVTYRAPSEFFNLLRPNLVNHKKKTRHRSGFPDANDNQ
ncbi:MAG: hypothetical protein ACR2G4_15945, partial [Pyrinomonadaceae bacterium]